MEEKRKFFFFFFEVVQEYTTKQPYTCTYLPGYKDFKIEKVKAN